ncbi:MAG: hypothetical protein HY519_03565, partial [Candidatus Aenigmarchaeota archaeon]|nr:hypothetical protein [Candidatus Aenigmarchaeota archaeon]
MRYSPKVQRDRGSLTWALLAILLAVAFVAIAYRFTGMLVSETGINVNVSQAQIVCSFFQVFPDIMIQNTSAVFRLGVRNCGNLNITNLTTVLTFVNASANLTSVLYNHTFPAYDLSTDGTQSFDYLFNGTFAIGTYYAIGNTSFLDRNGSENRAVTNISFQLLNATITYVNITVPVPYDVAVAGGGSGGGVAYESEVVYTVVRLNVSVPEHILNATRGNVLPVMIEVQNVGSGKVGNISLRSLLPQGWNHTSASISELAVKQVERRTVGI